MKELRLLQDVLYWASRQAKTDGIYLQVEEARGIVKRDINLKLMDPRKLRENDTMDGR